MVPMVQMVPMVPMVPIVPGVAAQGLDGSGGSEVAAQGLDGSELPMLLTLEALGKAGVGTHGGRRAWACIARRLRCVLRACGACAYAASEKGGLGPVGPS